MGILGSLIRAGLDPESRKLLAWIESEVAAGRMSRAEAERRQAELEKDLHKIFDSEEEQEKENA